MTDVEEPERPRFRPRLRELLTGLWAVAILAMLIAGAEGYPWWFITLAFPLVSIWGFTYLLRAFDRRPDVEFLDDGLVHRCARFPGDLFLPWSEVVEVNAPVAGHTVRVELRGEPLDSVVASPARRLELWLYRLTGQSTLALRPPLDVTGDEFAETLSTEAIGAERRSIFRP